jgi:hypothetical protein
MNDETDKVDTADEADKATAADKEKYGTLSEEELDDFDQAARERLERVIAARTAGDPAPGSEAAQELIREAIRQGGEWKEFKPEPVQPEEQK